MILYMITTPIVGLAAFFTIGVYLIIRYNEGRAYGGHGRNWIMTIFGLDVYFYQSAEEEPATVTNPATTDPTHKRGSYPLGLEEVTVGLVSLVMPLTLHFFLVVFACFEEILEIEDEKEFDESDNAKERSKETACERSYE